MFVLTNSDKGCARRVVLCSCCTGDVLTEKILQVSNSDFESSIKTETPWGKAEFWYTEEFPTKFEASLLTLRSWGIANMLTGGFDPVTWSEYRLDTSCNNVRPRPKERRNKFRASSVSTLASVRFAHNESAERKFGTASKLNCG